MKVTTCLFLTLLIFGFSLDDDFLSKQKKNVRVREAFMDKENLIETRLKEHSISLTNLQLAMVAFKDEGEVEVYGRSHRDSPYQLLHTYKICMSSGEPGPKRMAGDNQVPEGFYFIDRFNPYSNFYLSLGINYPNKSDKIKSKKNANPGGDIFIHGSCVTIWCIPITDDKIKDLYVCAVHATNNGQSKIPVYIFPFRMTGNNFDKFKKRYGTKSELISFWTNLKKGYDIFFSTYTELNFSVESYGDYLYLK